MLPRQQAVWTIRYNSICISGPVFMSIYSFFDSLDGNYELL